MERPLTQKKRVLYSDNFRILSDGQQIEGYESKLDFVAPWSRPEVAATYLPDDNDTPDDNGTASPISGSGDYLMSIRGGTNGTNGKALVASHLFEENNSGSVNGFAAQPSFNSEFFGYWPEQNWLAGDFNGDGFDDALNIYNNNYNEPNFLYQDQEIATFFTHLSDGDGFAEEDPREQSFSGKIAVSASDYSAYFSGERAAESFDVEKFLVGDFDGDGKDDIANVIGCERDSPGLCAFV